MTDKAEQRIKSIMASEYTPTRYTLTLTNRQDSKTVSLGCFSNPVELAWTLLDHAKKNDLRFKQYDDPLRLKKVIEEQGSLSHAYPTYFISDNDFYSFTYIITPV